MCVKLLAWYRVHSACSRMVAVITLQLMPSEGAVRPHSSSPCPSRTFAPPTLLSLAAPPRLPPLAGEGHSPDPSCSPHLLKPVVFRCVHFIHSPTLPRPQERRGAQVPCAYGAGPPVGAGRLGGNCPVSRAGAEGPRCLLVQLLHLPMRK